MSEYVENCARFALHTTMISDYNESIPNRCGKKWKMRARHHV